jgi:hypothetical protein
MSMWIEEHLWWASSNYDQWVWTVIYDWSHVMCSCLQSTSVLLSVNCEVSLRLSSYLCHVYLFWISGLLEMLSKNCCLLLIFSLRNVVRKLLFIAVKWSQNVVKTDVFYNFGYKGYYPNPKYRVPKNLGNAVLGQTSRSTFENPNF